MFEWLWKDTAAIAELIGEAVRRIGG